MEGNSRVAVASIRAWAIFAFAVTVAACGGSASPTVESSSANAGVMSAAVAQLPPFNFEIRTLSNRADLISDGDALVEVQCAEDRADEEGDAHAQRRGSSARSSWPTRRHAPCAAC